LYLTAGERRARVAHSAGEDFYDRVVLATHSDISRRLRGNDITREEAEVLDAIPYASNDVYLHTGARFVLL
jgi:uncharacterized protein